MVLQQIPTERIASQRLVWARGVGQYDSHHDHIFDSSVKHFSLPLFFPFDADLVIIIETYG